MRVKSLNQNIAQQTRQVSGILRGLAHETRLGILVSLQAGEQNVTSLMQALGCTQSALSQHLATMRIAGILKTRREGNQVFYRVSDPRIFQALDLIRQQALPPVA